jgi:hypothetical protein
VIALRRAGDDALVGAVQHVVGQSRAFLHLLESAHHEIGSLRDERANRLVEALGVTLREPAEPGTVRHVERTATELLRSLRTEQDG